ncbi:uncharacterized protein SPAPADRAFT_63445 [Spathaspora passalidarum NRRL Y-27907]|uniref:Uncharacterized protein n=1 Tax=Spathaspora passalidarum (strain NRRL Y-27907 / 11-Y1) TaxID=619300 RepID=G3AUR0_SPAPN|nr:uncharacterized protein SPAPADRAFT_63445 [Spathaspora passalidarum NRRL Y-27907]EGW30616.1 hypothetical protein SPAPADRAFT_63445 [Spathaspora passalidarum NRRL Y-27907]
MRQDETSSVHRSSRIILEAMVDASFGVEFGFGSILDDNIVEYTLRYRNVFKVFKSRYVESSMGCSTNKKGHAARVFGFIPIIHNKMRVRKIEYDAEEGTISKDDEFKSLPPVRKLSNGVLKTVCKVGTRDQLRCHENSGKFIDEYKNQFSFNVV